MQILSSRTAKAGVLESAAAGNFFMPSEAAPHAACWMAWPTRRELWGTRFDAVCAEYGEIARAIARFEPMIMVANAIDAPLAQKLCGPDVRVHQAEIDDSWMRDSGPTFLIDGQGRSAIVNWGFNAWGGKYHPHDKDAALKRHLAWDLDYPLIETPLIVEGGAIFSDGEGTIFTTESCLLNPNRNPDLSKAEIETELKRARARASIPFDKRRYVGVIPFKSEDSGTSLTALSKTLSLLVAAELQGRDEFVVLEREPCSGCGGRKG